MAAKDKALLALGIVNIVTGIVWGIVMEIVGAGLLLPISMIAITAGVLQIINGALLIYQKGKPVYYGALITAIAAGIAYILTPYMEDMGFVILCFVVAVVIYVKRRSFEKVTMIPGLIEIMQRRGMMTISQLAEQLKTTEANIELHIIELQSKGQPIRFDAEKREVIYG
jgi:hypothetical protein